MDIQEAIQLIDAYETWRPAYGQSDSDKASLFDAQAVNTATRLINDYAMKGGDVSGLPASVQKYATPEYANFVASRGSGTFGTALPALAVLGGGLAGVAMGGAAAAGTGATAGTEGVTVGTAAGGNAAGPTVLGTTSGLSPYVGATGAALPAMGPALTGGTTGGVATPAAQPAAAATTGVPAASGTALQRILDGTATTQDYLSLAGQVSPALLGMYASNKQTDALTGLADKYMAMGAPYRSRLTEISDNPSLFYDSPQAKQATESVLRRLSATHGNVAGSPYGQALTIDALSGEYGRERDRLAGFGGLTSYNAAAPGAATAAIGSQGNFYQALGGGIADVTTPRKQTLTLAEILRAGGY